MSEFRRDVIANALRRDGLPVVIQPGFLIAGLDKEPTMTRAEWESSTDPSKMLDYLTSTPRMLDGEQVGDGPLASPRKLRLFACACARQVWASLTDPRSRRAVEVAERFADGLSTKQELRVAWILAGEAADIIAQHTQQRGAIHDVWMTCHQESYNAARDCTLEPHGCPLSTQAVLLRCLFQPFRPVRLTTAAACGRCQGHGWVPRPSAQVHKTCPDCQGTGQVRTPPNWLTAGIVALAQAAYAERRRQCEVCRGAGEVEVPDDSEHGPWIESCFSCNATGRIDDGQLDPHLLGVLADKAEEDGCEDRNLLDHLRSAGPHVRGCASLDALLGKE